MINKEDWAPGGGDFNENPEWLEEWKRSIPLSEEAQSELDRITGEGEKRQNLIDRINQVGIDNSNPTGETS